MTQKIYLLIFLTLYFVVVFLLPSIRVKRKTGINPYVFKKTDSAHDYLGKVSPLITSIVFIVALVNLFFPNVYKYFAPFTWLVNSEIEFVGFILIHLSLFWIVVAQIQMNNSWRVGIDNSVKTELKTKGLFSVSRNPVFLGIIITLAAIFLILPNSFTLLTFVTSTLLFQIQVRLEESFLINMHGEIYSNYCKKVRRWF